LTMTQINRVISMYPTALEASEGLPLAK